MRDWLLWHWTIPFGAITLAINTYKEEVRAPERGAYTVPLRNSYHG